MGLQIPIINENATTSSHSVDEVIFGQPYNETLVHQLVVKYMAGSRAGTKGQKTRSEVSGGGMKPWRQKGTGRARSGSTRSPIWRTGGVTFAAKPRSYDQKLNKKMYKVAIKSIFSELLRQDRIAVIEDLSLSSHKTKDFVEKLKFIEGVKVLIVVDNIDKNLELASRNLGFVEVILASNLSPVLLVSADKVIVTPVALKKIEEHLA